VSLAYHRSVADTSAPGSTQSISWGSRILAPLALVAVVVAILVIVTQNTGADSKSGGGTSAKVESKGSKGDGDGAENPRRYEVQDGDTLGGIAEKFGVSTKRLERLNPDIDPQTLNAGQVITIR